MSLLDFVFTLQILMNVLWMSTTVQKMLCVSTLLAVSYVPAVKATVSMELNAQVYSHHQFSVLCIQMGRNFFIVKPIIEPVPHRPSTVHLCVIVEQ